IVGEDVPPYPKGFTSKSGSCAGPSLKELCNFSVNVLESESGKALALFAAIRSGTIGSKAIWRVTDQL
ncbi:unnamed protein product, partial [Scytosiphon promiscuus]